MERGYVYYICEETGNIVDLPHSGTPADDAVALPIMGGVGHNEEVHALGYKKAEKSNCFSGLK